jgi:MoaA/NifB/PqqE/SkfB family radical SAM enzyme
MSLEQKAGAPRKSAPYISVELTNICNLRCSYCIRDEDALYHTPAHFFPVELLRRIMRSAREGFGLAYVSFTGGEPGVHPQFAEVVRAVAEEGLQLSFVTNGWHFDRLHPALMAERAAVRHVAFSLDGATREAHDRWRGEGSFVRVVRGMARCKASGLPFVVKAAVRRDTLPQLQEFALFAARLGAAGLHFSHLLPTSTEFDRELGLDHDERAQAEQEISILSNIFKMQVGIATGYHDLDPAPPCAALDGRNCNVDYTGRLTLCCNLSGYRGAGGDSDVVADLTREDFAAAYPRLLRLAAEQVERRRQALAAHAERGRPADVYTSSPCLFCLQSFGKIPWRSPDSAGHAHARSLPVVGNATTPAGS